MVNIRGENWPSTDSRPLLMFSGGRDSTLAAARMAGLGNASTLVTVTSDHLRGLDAVRRRVDELSPLLVEGTRWLTVRQPDDLRTDTSFYARTCLPCHHAYVVVAAAIAQHQGAASLAMGYTAYQSDWPEQTPLAIASMRRVLAEHGMELLLPVEDIGDRDAAISELEGLGLSGASLEQKCSRQVTNVRLQPEHLAAQVTLWEAAIRTSLSSIDLIAASITGERAVGGVRR